SGSEQFSSYLAPSLIWLTTPAAAAAHTAATHATATATHAPVTATVAAAASLERIALPHLLLRTFTVAGVLIQPLHRRRIKPVSAIPAQTAHVQISRTWLVVTITDAIAISRLISLPSF